ncbi:hypothetical protein [Bacillus thuringiensis]|uniref:hypothetical protein n=1 Tax=Bacillus cereus group TaxID=86661 RepID=UPI003B982C57
MKKYLNNIIEQEHRFIKKRTNFSRSDICPKSKKLINYLFDLSTEEWSLFEIIFLFYTPFFAPEPFFFPIGKMLVPVTGILKTLNKNILFSKMNYTNKPPLCIIS